MRKFFVLVLMVLLFFIFILYSFSSHSQDNVIDSLEKVLQTQKEDTAKVNSLIALGREFRSSNTDTSLYFANAALTLATRLNYEMGIADSKRGRSALYASQGKFN